MGASIWLHGQSGKYGIITERNVLIALLAGSTPQSYCLCRMFLKEHYSQLRRFELPCCRRCNCLGRLLGRRVLEDCVRLLLAGSSALFPKMFLKEHYCVFPHRTPPPPDVLPPKENLREPPAHLPITSTQKCSSRNISPQGKLVFDTRWGRF